MQISNSGMSVLYNYIVCFQFMAVYFVHPQPLFIDTKGLMAQNTFD